MGCTDCRLPLNKDAHHEHDGVCCDCYDETFGMPETKRRRARPIVKPAALFIRDKKLLVVRTKGREQFYALGGKLEKNESEVDCLHREVQEEIGCEVTSERYYQTFVGPTSAPGLNKQVVMICYLVELDGEPRASSEIEELLWADSNSSESLGSLLRDHVISALKKDWLVD